MSSAFRSTVKGLARKLLGSADLRGFDVEVVEVGALEGDGHFDAKGAGADEEDVGVGFHHEHDRGVGQIAKKDAKKNIAKARARGWQSTTKLVGIRGFWGKNGVQGGRWPR